jgi:dihydroflavonol-4-reductase
MFRIVFWRRHEPPWQDRIAMTILVTGASGFIAKAIIAEALLAGYKVRGSLRNMGRAEEVRAAVRPQLSDRFDLDRKLQFVPLDLLADDGWTEALQGVTALVHTASPFPLSQPRDADELVRPAVDGTRRALKAAKRAGVEHVVLTASSVCIQYRDPKPGGAAFTEDDWSELDHPTMTAYGRSKTLAERAAWDFVREQAPTMALTTINPGLVLGEPLDEHFGSSMNLIRRILAGKDPAVPDLGFAVVDVSDVAKAHVRAIDRQLVHGKRVICAAGSMTFREIALAVKEACPGRRVPTMVAPHWLIRAIGMFDGAARSIVPQLGRVDRFSNERARDLLDIDFIPPHEAVERAARYLVSNGLV